ncbi:acyl-CoA dehydrogenase family protein [Acidisoma cellulosilytica]|uniref:Acyl-CoA dehydrogenase family protein n=1 Tax=Acidisoma cellulosilyticum TaxID=2802395 RepID=A0A964E664_9PROT|nr:acyl-CoA dehydrogenase family protein [Acidisoma cellulosilyticum]MCB8883395.1 acyl-CoA dehydrogenase family protein [Acidisoma cellulosilyticum]
MTETEAAFPAPSSPSYAALAERFRPIFRRIATDAIQREAERILPYEPIAWLKAAGFGALRIPVSDGGLGATIPELMGLMIELSAADSNVTQALRAHFGAVEDILAAGRSDRRARWLPRFVAGDLVGSALSEAAGNTLGSFETVLKAEGDILRLSGTKFYTTGTLYADWVHFAAELDGEIRSGFISATAEGVTRHDDWSGFGQKLTGSGTTVFDNAPVFPEDVFAFDARSKYRTAFYQLVHLATLSGIGRAAARDLTDQVAGRRRAYSHGAAGTVQTDPQVLQVVGHVRSLAYAAAAITLQTAQATQAVYDLSIGGKAEEADAATIISEISVDQAQPVVAKLVLEATETLFDALGASSTIRATALDRHWRNARTLSSHNPLIYKQRIVGDYAVNGTAPPSFWMVGGVG